MGYNALQEVTMRYKRLQKQCSPRTSLKIAQIFFFFLNDEKKKKWNNFLQLFKFSPAVDTVQIINTQNISPVGFHFFG